MARANAAYYATHDPYRDFTTAPEISQAFGEVLGAWAAVVWKQLGRPDPVHLVELGPGRGTLMSDALRAVARVAPQFRAALRVHLIEASPSLAARQAEQVPEATWHTRMEDVPGGPALVLANEFLDALPVRQFVHGPAGWAERYVAAGRFVLVPCPPPGREGHLVEVNEAAQALVEHLAARIARTGGAALFLDYGPAESAPGESLQALREGKPADPLAAPGQADLTAHVDFAALARAARAAGAAVHGPVPQGPFLVALGLMQRSFALARTQSPWRGAATIQAARRLVEPHRMGRLFKAITLCQPGTTAPPGFEP